MRILIAEDEAYLNRILEKVLTKAGYAVDSCADGQEALEYLESTDAYDAAILDIMMPRVDGLTVLRRIRERGSDLPVLLLTARDAVESRVEGLDLGADDYLTKPFATQELLARLRALLRRGGAKQAAVLALADLRLDPASRRVTRGGREIALSAREFALLEYMMRNQGAVLTREQLENHVWDYGFEGGSNIVDVYVRYLRRKIDEPFEKKLIHTVRGMGYALREEP